jgi:hypothetical protein
VDVTLANGIGGGGNTALGADTNNGYIRFERGPESMFRRVQIQDSSGNLLESIENYNDLYCLTELLSDNVSNRKGVSTFHGEGLVLLNQGYQPLVASGQPAANAAYIDPISNNHFYNVNSKLPTLKFLDLGGVAVGKMEGGIDTTNVAN